jgi:tetracycline 7-halogenase / FADH2 O2-dependent halogenase
MNQQVDVTIIGSGFSGSILAWVLAKQGLQVALIDSAKHPRFAVGESSTPIADMLLRRLGETYQLQELVSLSTYGGWQRDHPELTCGRKRGFSYFLHQPGQAFSEQRLGENSLLVAASASDDVADTHWYRAEVDQFFYGKACDAGVIDMTGHSVTALSSEHRQQLVRCSGHHELSILSDWIIDASGRSSVLAKLAGATELTDQLLTHTRSTFAHYSGVESWPVEPEDPFDPNDAAQHHLLNHGWLWMLRFNQGITSVGYTTGLDQELKWSGYPSIDQMFRTARLVPPFTAPISTGRLQKFYDPVVDHRRIMLPTAAVTLDPLHSTGIAHALAGVDRIARLILEEREPTRLDLINAYRTAVIQETRVLDRLVSTAYATMHDFSRLTTACMLYFAGAIACEERYQAGQTPGRLWNTDDEAFVATANWACDQLLNAEDDPVDLIRERLSPWNTAGLLDSGVNNRYAYTATKTA